MEQKKNPQAVLDVLNYYDATNKEQQEPKMKYMTNIKPPSKWSQTLGGIGQRGGRGKGCSNIQCFISLIDKISLKKGNFILFSVIVKFYTVYKGEKEIQFFYSTLRVNSLGMKACW